VWHIKPQSSILEIPEPLQIKVRDAGKYGKEAKAEIDGRHAAMAYGDGPVKTLMRVLTERGYTGARIDVGRPDGVFIRVVGGSVQPAKGICKGCGQPTHKAPQAKWCDPCKREQGTLAVRLHRSREKGMIDGKDDCSSA
jgi:hypothetical protein